MDIKDELVLDLARLEELTEQQLITIVKKILVAAGTGYDIDELNGPYQQFYAELDKRFEQDQRPHPNLFSDLWEFYSYWKENELSTYASRRAYVAKIYKNVKQQPQSNWEEHFWQLLHPDVAAIAQSRYDSKNYADSVEAVLKELNTRVKNIVKQKTGKELDGSSLMERALSVQNPILVLDDLETEDGKNIQKGYMQIFAGAMTGIRNPKAHGNVILQPDECQHLLIFASMLFKKLDAPIAKSELQPSQDVKEGLYIRIKDADDTETLIAIRGIINAYPGNSPVVLVIGSQKKSGLRLPMGVKISKALTNEIEGVVGRENIIVQKSNG